MFIHLTASPHTLRSPTPGADAAGRRGKKSGMYVYYMCIICFCSTSNICIISNSISFSIICVTSNS